MPLGIRDGARAGPRGRWRRRQEVATVGHDEQDVLERLRDGFLERVVERGEGVAGAAVHEPVEHLQDVRPELDHALPRRELAEVVQEDFAEQRRGLHARFRHADRVGLVDFWAEELVDEGEEDGREERSPDVVEFAFGRRGGGGSGGGSASRIGGSRGECERWGEESTLKRCEGLVSD